MGFRRVSAYVCESVCGKTAAHVEKVGGKERKDWKKVKRKEKKLDVGDWEEMGGREEVEKSRGRQTKEGERWK